MKRDWLQIATNIGVIIGLGALVYEINQTDQHALANIAESNYHLTSANLNTQMGENPAAVIAKAMSNPIELTLEERLVLNAHYKQVVFEADLHRTMAAVGIYDSDSWQQNVQGIALSNLAYPYAREWWSRNRDRFAPELRELIDAVVKDNPNATLERLDYQAESSDV